MIKTLFPLCFISILFSHLSSSQIDTTKRNHHDSVSTSENAAKIESANELFRQRLRGHFLFGNGFAEDRGAGLGIRGTYEIKNNFFIGGTFVIHLGPAKNTLTAGYGTMYYSGGEIGGRIKTSFLLFEPLVSAGEALLQIPNYEHATSMEGKLYVAPGMSVKTVFETSNIGIHVRYLFIDSFGFFALYFSYGQ